MGKNKKNDTGKRHILASVKNKPCLQSIRGIKDDIQARLETHRAAPISSDPEPLAAVLSLQRYTSPADLEHNKSKEGTPNRIVGYAGTMGSSCCLQITWEKLDSGEQPLMMIVHCEVTQYLINTLEFSEYISEIHPKFNFTIR